MLAGHTPSGSFFRCGEIFPLSKPLALLQVLHSLRAAQGFMQADRRRSSRSNSQTLAYLQLPTGTTPALVQDVTEQGISIQAPDPLLPLRAVSLRFRFPGTAHVVDATAVLILAAEPGRACHSFVDVPA